MKKIVIANWKMNPQTHAQATRLAMAVDSGVKNIKNIDVVIAPPFVFLQALSDLSLSARLGSQDVFWETVGAYTGEISPAQLKTYGVRYAIVGHSEKRVLGETNTAINKKLKSALGAGLYAVLCVGEKDKEKSDAFPQIIRDELRAGLKKIKKSLFKNLIVAYEPVWAIGTGRADTPRGIYEMAVMIRRELHRMVGRRIAEQIPVLYGGSVDETNAGLFVKDGCVDGLLIGGASLNDNQFIKIVKKVDVL